MAKAPKVNDEITVSDVEDEILNTEPKIVSIFDLCETDSDAEENGRWFKDIFEDGSNINVKLRRMTSRASVVVRRRLEKQYKKHQDRRGNWPDDINEKMINMQIAEVIVVDWENMVDRDGTAIPCTKDSILTLVTRLPTLRDIIAVFSAEMDNYRVATVEDSEKN